MDRREFLKATALGAMALALPRSLQAAAVGAADSRPNIIFILSDDVGLGNLTCYGSDQFNTPQLDALAKSGIRFEQCYSTPLCGPSRSQLLTGRYPFRTGMISNQSGGVLRPENEIMIPTVLKQAGYVTASIGKWNQLPLQPGDWGFDEYLRFAGSGKYWRSQDPTYIRNGQQQDLPEGKYLPDVMHEFLVDFMTRHRNQPFYVHYPMSHIHGPIMRTHDSTPDSTDFYRDNVAYMDKLVGELVAELERLKLCDHTLVVFVGDNGTATGFDERATVNGGKRFSGRKGTMLEGGSRVPLIASWAGTTPAGKVSTDLIDFSDFFATLADLARATLPQSVTIDGRSFAPQLQGRPGSSREWVYVELNGEWYVRSARWKLNSAGELFDMKDAPFAEKAVPADTTDGEPIAAKQRLQAVLDQLNPAAGKQAAPGRRPGVRLRRRKRRTAAYQLLTR